jgi:hypothetical protein
MKRPTCKIYITYCSARKDDKYSANGRPVFPHQLYKGKGRIEPFMNKCMAKGVDWAIFSDKYSVWFPNIRHKWYDKHPDTVTEKEFKKLLSYFDSRLRKYNQIAFYHRGPRPLHGLYRRILKESGLKNRIKVINSVKMIR